MFNKVTERVVDVDAAEQRLDNYLMALVKNVPKSRIYRAIRKGEVRLNGGRCQATTRLQAGDKLRLPPFRQDLGIEIKVPDAMLAEIRAAIVYEDEDLLVLNKPVGLSSQGGSGIRYAVIDILHELGPSYQYCRLVHRLDKPTSGCLLIAKNRLICAQLQQDWQAEQVEKTYWAVLKGTWKGGEHLVEANLERIEGKAGHMMVVSEQGKPAQTRFNPEQTTASATIVHAHPLTGRLHQIRAHAAYLQQPIWGDEKYGDFALNRELSQQGIKRLCLHALTLSFPHPRSGERLTIETPVPSELIAAVQKITGLSSI